MQDNKKYSKTRQYYRIRYPHSSRPRVRIWGENHEGRVVELSERGVRFFLADMIPLKAGAELRVAITFHDGQTFDLKGEILRAVEKDIILRFSESLPLTRIINEQIYLRTHFIGHM